MVCEGDWVSCWDEPVFRYLLAVEAARARRAGRPFLVLLVDVRGAGRWGVQPTGGLSDGVPDLAAALTRCLRETDLMGWHRTGRTAGVLLTATDPEPDAARVVGTKVLRSLEAALSPEIARGLRIRIHRYDTSGTRPGFHCVFPAARAGKAMAPAESASAADSRAADAVARPHPAGSAAAERDGAAARGMPTNTSTGPRLAEAAVSRRASV